MAQLQEQPFRFPLVKLFLASVVVGLISFAGYTYYQTNSATYKNNTRINKPEYVNKSDEHGVKETAVINTDKENTDKENTDKENTDKENTDKETATDIQEVLTDKTSKKGTKSQQDLLDKTNNNINTNVNADKTKNNVKIDGRLDAKQRALGKNQKNNQSAADLTENNSAFMSLKNDTEKTVSGNTTYDVKTNSQTNSSSILHKETINSNGNIFTNSITGFKRNL